VNESATRESSVCLVSLLLAVAVTWGCAQNYTRIVPMSNSSKMSMTFDYSSDIAINYEAVSGGETAVVFLHGFGASLRNWDDIRPLLVPGPSYFFLDLKGFGMSSRPRDEHYALEDQARIVSSFISRQIRASKVVLVGHSYGAAVAVLVHLARVDSKEASELSGLVLIDGTLYPHDLPPFVVHLRTPLWNQLVTRLLSCRFQVRHALPASFLNQRVVTESLVDRYLQSYSPLGSRYSFIKAAEQVLPEEPERFVRRFSDVHVPTLLVWGEQDKIAPLADGRALGAALANSHLVVIPDCGHVPQEEKPQEAAGYLNEFLARFLEE